MKILRITSQTILLLLLSWQVVAQIPLAQYYIACPNTTITIEVEANPTCNYMWYNAQTAGTLLGTGNSCNIVKDNSEMQYVYVACGETGNRVPVVIYLNTFCGNTQTQPIDCPEGNEEMIFYYEDFGGNSVSDPHISPTNHISNCYSQLTWVSSLMDGHYYYDKHNIPADGSPYFFNNTDHTFEGDSTKGYMVAVHPTLNFINGILYGLVIDNLPSNQPLNFTLWAMDFQVRFEAPKFSIQLLNATDNELLVQTGIHILPRAATVNDNPIWGQYGFQYTLPDGVTSVKIQCRNHNPLYVGNDWALDDFQVSGCVSPVVSFSVNNILYSVIDSLSFCEAFPIVVNANIPPNLTVDSLKWYLNGIEQVAQRDNIVWHDTLLAGNYVIAMQLNELDTLFTTIFIYPNKWVYLSDTICDGESYNFNDSILYTAGTYINTLATIYGCDSIVTLTLRVNESYFSITDTCCAAGTYMRNGFSIPVPAAGLYLDTLRFTASSGCDSIIALQLIAGAPPTISAVVDENPCVANTSSISLSFAGGLAPYYCIWNNGATTPAIDNLPYGTYTALVSDSINCKTEYTTTLTASDFQASATATTPSHCGEANGGAIVHVSGGSGNYSFVPAGSNAVPVSFLCDDFIFDNLPAGNYHIAVTDSVCTLNIAFTITNLGNPEANFYTQYNANNIEIPVHFINYSRHATSYFWDFGDGNNSTEENPFHYYNDYGQYTVTILVTDDYNCIDSFSNVIKLIELAYCYFPKAFTPNNNGINETFGPICHNIQTKDYLFVIYDRWGNRVFESQDINHQWNGMINGKEAVPAVYVWHLFYRDERHKLQERKGIVTLIR